MRQFSMLALLACCSLVLAADFAEAGRFRPRRFYRAPVFYSAPPAVFYQRTVPNVQVAPVIQRGPGPVLVQPRPMWPAQPQGTPIVPPFIGG